MTENHCQLIAAWQLYVAGTAGGRMYTSAHRLEGRGFLSQPQEGLRYLQSLTHVPYMLPISFQVTLTEENALLSVLKILNPIWTYEFAFAILQLHQAKGYQLW